MKIIIVRHGKTDYNVLSKMAGQSDDAKLVDEGLEHSQNLAELLRDEEIDAIYASPLARAYETAKPVAEVKELEIITDSRIIEMDFGVMDGKKLEEPEVRKYLIRRLEDPDYRVQGGESYNDVIIRVRKYLQDITGKRYGQALHVAHLGVNRAVLSELTGTDIKKMRKLCTWNEIVYTVDVDSGSCSWVSSKTGQCGEGLLWQ